VAAGIEGVIHHAPPRWLEALLVWCLAARDRETISGDLLEEYREVQLPQLGPMRANLWYMRQSISFLSVRSFGGPPAKAALAWISAFATIAGFWLVLMERILKHGGYTERTAAAAYIAIQGVATLFLLISDDRPILRALVVTGAVGVGLLGAAAVLRTFYGFHFEGFVVLIGLAVTLQSMLTCVLVFGARHRKTP
jgi:hypothetical protein